MVTPQSYSLLCISRSHDFNITHHGIRSDTHYDAFFNGSCWGPMEHSRGIVSEKCKWLVSILFAMEWYQWWRQFWSFIFFLSKSSFFFFKWQYKHFSIQFMTEIQISQTYLKKYIQIWWTYFMTVCSKSMSTRSFTILPFFSTFNWKCYQN